VERRGLTKRKSFSRKEALTQGVDFLLPRFYRLGKVAKSNKHLQLNSLFHQLNVTLLHKMINKLNRKS
jgi:hypothetical protein